MDILLAQLGDLYINMYNISAGSRAQETAFTAAKLRMGDADKDIIAKIRQDAHQYPDPAANVIKSAAAQSWGLVLTGARAYINGVWRSTALPDCQRGIDGRYPVAPRGREEITLADFGRFFGSGGTLNHFTADYLQPLRPRLAPGRRGSRTSAGMDLFLPRPPLTQFRHAARIRTVYFQDGGQQPSLHFCHEARSHCPPTPASFSWRSTARISSTATGR